MKVGGICFFVNLVVRARTMRLPLHNTYTYNRTFLVIFQVENITRIYFFISEVFEYKNYSNNKLKMIEFLIKLSGVLKKHRFVFIYTNPGTPVL